MRIQIILAGIGGQGILFSSKLFSELALKQNLNVVGTETHGMSQRGGSVSAHLKLGNFQSPMIRAGAADILYSLDKDETYRTLKFLKTGGICFANLEDKDLFDTGVLLHLKKKGIVFRSYDASGKALELGSIRSTNIVLIGYSAGTGLIPFKYQDIRNVLELVSRKKNLKMNLKALEAGFQEGQLTKNNLC